MRKPAHVQMTPLPNWHEFIRFGMTPVSKTKSNRPAKKTIKKPAMSAKEDEEAKVHKSPKTAMKPVKKKAMTSINMPVSPMKKAMKTMKKPAKPADAAAVEADSALAIVPEGVPGAGGWGWDADPMDFRFEEHREWATDQLRKRGFGRVKPQQEPQHGAGKLRTVEVKRRPGNELVQIAVAKKVMDTGLGWTVRFAGDVRSELFDVCGRKRMGES